MSVLQRHWDARAAANFILGGTGSGLLVVGVLGSLSDERFIFASLVLIAAGLGAVWLEIGRKLRASHVFFNPFTSWMTRESFAALLVFLLAGSFLAWHGPVLLYGMALAAAAFLYCQARILHAAKGIPAWRVPEIVPLVVGTGLAEGAALALFFSSAPVVAGLFMLAVAARFIAWRRYRRAVPGGGLGRADVLLLRLGTALALALVLLSYFIPWLVHPAVLAALGTGWWLKFALVTRASFKQDFSLPHLPVRGAPQGRHS